MRTTRLCLLAALFVLTAIPAHASIRFLNQVDGYDCASGMNTDDCFGPTSVSGWSLTTACKAEGRYSERCNIGACYYYLGNPAKEKVCAETAMRMFEDLEQHIDAIRPRTLLVLLLMEEGRQSRGKYSAAAAELFKSRAAWLAAGRKNEAAHTMVRIVRVLILAGRAQDVNWPEMVRTFTAARLDEGAMRALLYLRDVAAQRELLLSDVQEAEDMLARLAPSCNTFEKTG